MELSSLCIMMASTVICTWTLWGQLPAITWELTRMSDNLNYEGFSVLIELLNGAKFMLLRIHAQSSHITIYQEVTPSINVQYTSHKLAFKDDYILYYHGVILLLVITDKLVCSHSLQLANRTSQRLLFTCHVYPTSMHTRNTRKTSDKI